MESRLLGSGAAGRGVRKARSVVLSGLDERCDGRSQSRSTVCYLVVSVGVSCMTLMLSQCVPLALSMFLLAIPAYAQSGDSPPQPVPPGNAEANLSPECRVPTSELYALAPLRRVRSATEQKHALKVLALGPTSASALAPGTGLAPFPARLEHELEKVLPGVDVTVEGRSLSGEITAHASPTIMNLVSEVEPDLARISHR